jgi:hypothetical protein
MPRQLHAFLERACQREEVLNCGKSRFIDVVNEDGDKVMIEVAHKQLHYFPITTHLKWLFIS